MMMAALLDVMIQGVVCYVDEYFFPAIVFKNPMATIPSRSVGYYPLKSSTGANDTSSLQNPAGTIFNSNPAPGVYGETGGSYAFTGSRSPPSFIYLNGSHALDTRYSITLLAWVYSEQTGGEIVSYWKNSNYGVGISLDNSRPVFHVYSRDQSTKHSIPGPNNLPLNQWVHLAGAYDNNTGNAVLLWMEYKWHKRAFIVLS
ncbi:hypothetical protein OS493_033796 [Desmophyllum pertusum]|uniref:LamG domain-containing protein n=1 Tax=Desmophyllum pertusum TaxID=174260 RepID=A0A9W9YVF3_9CNID|nr:hypothetical protein OS493_033796 [Desmophyllum pertusum]